MIFKIKPDALKEYFASARINQTSAKALMEGLSEYNKVVDSSDPIAKMYFEESPEHFIIGSAVDSMLTQNDVFFEEYHISKVMNKPSDKIISILMYVLDKIKQEYKQQQSIDELTPNTLKEFWENKQTAEIEALVIEGCDEHQYYPKWGAESRIKAVGIDSDYFTDLINADGKQVLTEVQYQNILDIVTSLRSYMPNIFGDQYKTSNNTHILFQLPVYFELADGISAKALLDIVVIDMSQRSVTIYDLKTMYGKTYNFYHQSFLPRGYDFQATWYRNAIIKAMEQQVFSNSMSSMQYEIPVTNSEEEEKEMESYLNSIEGILINRMNSLNIINQNFRFIVESTSEPGKPLMYEMSPKAMDAVYRGHASLYGDMISRNGEVYPFLMRKARLGIPGFIKLYTWYKRSNFERDYKYHILVNSDYRTITPTGLEDPFDNFLGNT